MSFQSVALIVAWVAIILLALVVAELAREVGVIRGRGRTKRQMVGGGIVGEAAPHLNGVDYAKAMTLVLFADASCNSCETVEPVFRNTVGPGAQHVLVYRQGQPKSAVITPGVAVLEQQTGAFAGFGVPATPFCAVVDRNGVIIGNEPVGSPRLLREFIQVHMPELKEAL